MKRVMQTLTAGSLMFAALTLADCSGGVSVAPSTGSAKIPDPMSFSPTPGPSESPSPASTATPTGPVSATPTPAMTPTASSAPSGAPAPTVTPTIAPTATPTAGGTMVSGCPASFPSTQPISNTQAFPSAGGPLKVPTLGDINGVVTVPSNNASASEMITIQDSQTTFTDANGNGNIPAPPSGQTAIIYTASQVNPVEAINFNSSNITVSETAPCEITTGHTYVAYVYANGGGLNHDELSPTAGYPVTLTTSNGVTAANFTINLSGNAVPNYEPSGTGLETVLAQK